MQNANLEQKYHFFHEIFQNMTEEEAAKPALYCGDQIYSYGELDKAVLLCASDLIEMGVQKGDHVGLWSFNSANVLIAYLAIVRVGAVAVMGNFTMQLSEIRELFDMTDITYLIHGPVRISRNDPQVPEKLAEDLGIPKNQCYDISPTALDFHHRLDEKPIHLDEIQVRTETDRPDRNAFIIFTTGTTSKPKAVLDHQEGLLFTTYRHYELRKCRMGDAVAIALPLFHIFGLFVIFSYMHKKASIHLAQRVSADYMIEELEAYNNISDLATVTAVYQSMVEHERFASVERQVRLMTTAGGLLTMVQFAKLELAFTNGWLFNEYGQTESHGCISFCDTDLPLEKRSRSLGRSYTPDEIKLWDSGKGFVKQGEIGEICIKTPAVMNGYYKLEPEKQAIDRDGWLHTGDLGVFDDSGLLRLAGRAKDIIIRNGENISPVEVENVISTSKQVSEVKIFGMPHPIYGETVECCLVLEKNQEFDEQALRAEIKEKVSAFKVPSHFFVYDQFPLAPSGKLDQRGLRIRLADDLRRLVIEQELSKGVVAMQLSIKNSSYNITPITNLFRGLCENIGYSQSRLTGIALAVEEMLTERIINAFQDVGDIHLRVIFYKEWLCVEFSDSGEDYEIRKNLESNMCAKLILNYVDDFLVEKKQNAPSRYRLDFLYQKDFDIKEYLLRHERRDGGQ